MAYAPPPTSAPAHEDACRWAYAKAMRVAAIRDALLRLGRAIYQEPVIVLGDLSSVPSRFVLSRVDLHATGRDVLSLTYCNGVRVA